MVGARIRSIAFTRHTPLDIRLQRVLVLIQLPFQPDIWMIVLEKKTPRASLLEKCLAGIKRFKG